MDKVFVPTRDDMEEEIGGVLVTSFEAGGAIAITSDKRAALEALDTYYRQVCGFVNLLDDSSRLLTDAYYYLNTGHVLFWRTEEGGWAVKPVASTTLGAVGVTWFEEPDAAPVPAPYAGVRSGSPATGIW